MASVQLTIGNWQCLCPTRYRVVVLTSCHAAASVLEA
jgi:hypothetical protein